MTDLGKKHNLNTEFTKAMMDEAKVKGGVKSLGDTIGLPDSQDKEYIRRLILKYDRKNPGAIKFIRDEARAQHHAVGGKTAEWGLVNNEAHGRLLFELPEDLVHLIETSYPLMFRDRTHFKWFVKHFKELMIPDKY